MNEREVRECIRSMSSCYGVPEPYVLIGGEYFREVPRNWLAYYDDKTRTIYLRPDKLEERIVVHEFAHYLQTALGIPNERGATKAEEIIKCGVCNRVIPAPRTELGSTALCPWCGSTYRMVEAPEEKPTFPVGPVLALTSVVLGVTGLLHGYRFR